MTRILVKPVGDVIVRDRYGRVVPKEGAIDKWSSWWGREEKDGHVTLSPYEEPKPKRRKRTTKNDDVKASQEQPTTKEEG